MSSFADRNREAVINQLQNDERIGTDTILSVAPLMRVSVMLLVISGIVGVLVFQILFGFGGLQFGIGLVLGYVAYVLIALRTMGAPRVIGAMGVLTDRRLMLLGSKRVGIAGEWSLSDLDSIELTRKGNLLVMGKIMVVPKEGKAMGFYLSNRGMGVHFMDAYRELQA
ncbi:MAG: hypothetical protein QNJ75_12455 [Acidimicrobiia bacterium]|nr:hypothetical protein [Acidimicrobiia bacterium]